MTSTLSELRDQCAGWRGKGPEYTGKQIHRLPAPMPVVVRETFILERCTGKTVLDIGASGTMHDAIKTVARRCYGIDRPPPGWSAILPFEDGDRFGIDLDDYHAKMPSLPDVQIIVCGEVLEHLSNPGWLLGRLKMEYPNVPVIVTVPNAYSAGSRGPLQEGFECVNVDHVTWHSPRTIQTLVERAGYQIEQWAWYKGVPPYCEGIIVALR